MAGLVQTTVADSEVLSPEDAEQLRAKVKEAQLFSTPRQTSSSNQPDRFHYAVTVEDNDGKHTVFLNGEDLPDTVRSLISWVSSLPSREDRLSSPGEDSSS